MTLYLSVAEYAQMRGTKPRKPSPAKQRSQVSKLASDTRMQLAGLPAWVTEHRFHPTRRWRFDYCWPELKIAVEVHGGTYTNGRHTRGLGFTGDREKMNEAAIYGWTVLEVTTAHVRSGQMRQWLDRIFEHKGVAA